MSVRTKLQKIPIFGELLKCTFNDHSTAFTELLITLIFLMSPIGIAVLGDFYTIQNRTEFEFFLSLKNKFSNGELFLYVTSLTAPIFYAILRKRKSEDRFPSRLFLGLVMFALLMISSASFAYQRSGGVNQSSILSVSIWIFIFSLMIYYVVTVYNNRIIFNVAETMRDEEDSFTQKVNQHRNKS